MLNVAQDSEILRRHFRDFKRQNYYWT